MRSRVAWSAAPIDDTRSMFFSGPVPSRHGRGQNLLLKRNYTSSVQEWSRKSPEFLLVNQPQKARSCKTYISGETQRRRDHGARSVLTDTRPYGCVCFLYIYLRSLQWPIFLNFYLTWARMCHVCIRVSLTPGTIVFFFFLVIEQQVCQTGDICIYLKIVWFVFGVNDEFSCHFLWPLMWKFLNFGVN